MVAYYKILGVPQTANKEDIKKAYRKLSMIYHPDRPNGNANKFLEIKTAYEALMKPDVTKIHDQYQHRRTPYHHVDKVTVDENGDCRINVTLRHIIFIETMGNLDGYYHWSTFGYTAGELVIKKKDLIRCGFIFMLRFSSLVDDEFRIVHLDDNRNWLGRTIDKIKSFF